MIPNKSVRVRPAGKPVALRPGPQLLIDAYLVAESSGLTKTTHPPERFLDRPVLGWREHTTQPYVTVLRDPATRRFRMWYDYDIGADGRIGYAESDDGIRWTLPKLGILGPDNRLFKISSPFQNGYGVSVIDDGPRCADRAKRYKIAWWGQTRPWPDGDPGLRVAFSADGVHWQPYEGNPVLPDFSEKQFLNDPRRPYGVGDIVDVFRDPIRRRYGALFKTPAVPSDGYEPGPRAKTYIRRLVSASVSDDFVHWQRPWRVIVPEPRDKGLLEFYGAAGTIARGPLLISFVRMLHDDYPCEPGGPATGIGYTTLATSRDGEHWERHDDVFFDRNSKPGAWDRAMAWIGSAVPVGDELYLYYGGYKRGHKIEARKERQLGLVKMPMDRFVSRDATGPKPGRLLTVPLSLRGVARSALTLNADASRGRIRVQVRDANGAVIDGFGFDACAPITGDGLALPVRWPKPLSALGPRVVCLEFALHKASLFGFSFSARKPRP